MLKKVIFVIFCSIVLINPKLYSCDICGLGSSNLGLGLITDFQKNFVRISYFNSKFRTNNSLENQISDKFIQYDLSLRYAFGKSDKLRLMAHLPFGINTRYETDLQQNEKGLADFRFNVNYVFLNNKTIGKKLKLYLETGGGLSLPTGKFNDNIEEERDLPENFNIGKGTFAYIFQMNSILSWKNNGIILGNNYLINNSTKTYNFGNQWNTQLSFYKILPLSKLKLRIIPNVGFSFENIAIDKYDDGNKVHGTGGSGTFLNTTINIRTKKCLAGFTYLPSILENYADGEVNAKNRFACQISYIF